MCPNHHDKYIPDDDSFMIQHVKATKSASQTISTGGSWKTVTFDTEEADTNNYHDLVTNNHYLHLTPGTWLITFYAQWASDTVGLRRSRLKEAGTALALDYYDAPVTGFAPLQIILQRTLTSNKDYLAEVYHTSTGDLELSEKTYLSAMRIS